MIVLQKHHDDDFLKLVIAPDQAKKVIKEMNRCLKDNPEKLVCLCFDEYPIEGDDGNEVSGTLRVDSVDALIGDGIKTDYVLCIETPMRTD